MDTSAPYMENYLMVFTPTRKYYHHGHRQWKRSSTETLTQNHTPPAPPTQTNNPTSTDQPSILPSIASTCIWQWQRAGQPKEKLVKLLNFNPGWRWVWMLYECSAACRSDPDPVMQSPSCLIGTGMSGRYSMKGWMHVIIRCQLKKKMNKIKIIIIARPKGGLFRYHVKRIHFHNASIWFSVRHFDEAKLKASYYYGWGSAAII